jgi:hypothetical protein
MRFLKSSPVQPQTAAGKLTTRVKSRARCVAIIAFAFVASAISVAPAFAEFGIAPLSGPSKIPGFAISAREKDGSRDVLAGSHPYALNTTIVLNEQGATTGNLKDVRLELPPGLVGNPDATPKCTYQEFIRQVKGGAEGGQCPNETAVGVATFYIQKGVTPEARETAVASSSSVYNLVPPTGVAAEFGYVGAETTPVLLEESVRSGKDYGVTTTVPNVNTKVNVFASKVTIWGVPAESSHDDWRGSCVKTLGGGTAPVAEHFGLSEASEEDEVEGPLRLPGEEVEPEGLPESVGSCGTGAPLRPLLSLPTSCGRPLVATLSVDSWQEPGNFLGAEGTRTKTVSLPEMQGCQGLALSPRVTVTPDKPDASTSSGLAVDVKIPQEGTLSPSGVAEADVRNTTVVLPPGVALNPSAANGLEACSEGLATFTGMSGEINPGSETATFTPFIPGGATALLAGEKAPFDAGVNFCPNASKIGTVKIKLAVLEQPLEGAVYLAAQEANPFGSLMAVYFVAEDPVSGVVVKLPGEVTLCKSVGEDPLNAAGEPIPGVNCQAVGQVVTTLLNTPQAPVEEFEAHFFGGEKAPLTTPAFCRDNTPEHPGEYATEASFVPWGGETKHTYPTFKIEQGPNGGPCPGGGGAGSNNSLPFSPGLTGGALNLNAGAFSPFTLTMNRSDGEQNMQSVEAKLPPGLAGILTGVELCPEPQANLGECGPNSLIGETTVSVGVGGDPYTDTGGKFYLTGPYNGTGTCTVGQPGCAPFGITFAVPAKAGPFDLAKTANNHPACDCIVVRGKIEVNPLTAALTITSNPPGTPDSIPTSIEGIPLEIQHINAITTRNNFQFNPTNCSKMEVSGTIHSSVGGTDTIGVPFQLANCQALKFEPKVAVSTRAKTSKADGASLSFKFTNPSVAPGIDANYSKFKVELPKQLPSRLTTLQKACTAAQFDANPAGCPAASVVGAMKVITPVLPVPVEGPMYFVSNGGEAFPNLIVVLQGYGVTVHLVGDTFISKAGITSSTFKAIPDLSFTSAEVVLPEGKYSALAANGNLCQEASKLKIPTEFVAQNGAVIHQSTPISVSGCPKAKTAAQLRAQKLAAALKACHKKKGSKRSSCEKAARKKYKKK